jgi:hypothetical protein
MCTQWVCVIAEEDHIFHTNQLLNLPKFCFGERHISTILKSEQIYSRENRFSTIQTSKRYSRAKQYQNFLSKSIQKQEGAMEIFPTDRVCQTELKQK